MKKIPLLLFLGCSLQLSAQSISPSTINVQGGTATLSGNTYSWSVGEIARINTISGSDIIVTEGLLQPSDLPTSTEDLPNLRQLVSVYPNPASKDVFIQPHLPANSKLNYVLSDVLGRILLDETITLSSGTERQVISLSGQANGTYFLSLYTIQKEQTSSTTFKLLKR